MPEPTFYIDPDAKLDYKFNWAAWLDEDETIDGHTIVSTDGISVDSSSRDSGVVTVWVSAAEPRYQRVTCHIVTSAGREDDRTIRFDVRSR